MLTADLVRARRRGSKLQLLGLSDEARARALLVARRYLQLARACVGDTRESFDEACGGVPVASRDRRLAAGLLKLVRDRCEFEAEPGVDPRDLRREVFVRAASARRAASAHPTPAIAVFDRARVVAEVASDRGLSPEELERLLFADLRSAHRLIRFEPITAEELVAGYEDAQAQAVLLRAVRVEVDVRCGSAAALRQLFHRLKFLRLLFSVTRQGEGSYRIVIDGPHSLFASVTRYGLQLALLLPVLRATDRYALRAELLWGKERTPLSFELAGGTDHAGDGREPRAGRAGRRGSGPLGEDAAALHERFRKRETSWRARPCAEILNLPGVGLCVPDLVFERPDDGARVYLEVLGYWSREAVWRRVALVEAGLPQRILFAVSERLRVSEAALDEQLPGALYVYKGVMHAGAVEERLDQLASRR